jgi:hypothetical protein
MDRQQKEHYISISNGSKDAHGLVFSLNEETKSSQVKGLLSKIGLLGSNVMVNYSGFTLINPVKSCDTIPAGGSCVLNFSTPNLSVGGSGNSVVGLNYSLDGKQYKTNQVVSYRYLDINSVSGVNFSGSLNVNIAQGKSGYVVGYLYGGGVAGTKYSNVSLTTPASNVVINNGFINNQEVASGQVIAVEYKINSQNSVPTTVTVTPSWSGSKVYTSQGLQSASLSSGNNVGVPLQIGLTPSLNAVNFVVGTIPVMTAPNSSTPVTINVTNNGNAATASNKYLIAVADPLDSDLIIGGTCPATVLESNASNTCTFTFSTTSVSPGSATVKYMYNGGEVGSAMVYWTNDKPVPMVSLVPNNPTVDIFRYTATPENSTIFTVTNLGKAPLESMNIESYINSDVITWIQDGTNCGSSLAVNGTCTISGHFVGTVDTQGVLYYRALGWFNNESYNFASLPVRYIVRGGPVLTLTPSTVNMNIVANGRESALQTFTVTNTGDATARFTKMELIDSKIGLKPQIVQGAGAGTCTESTILSESQGSTPSCTVVVSYGPASPAEYTSNDSGVSKLTVSYTGGTPVVNASIQSTINYSLIGNSVYLSISGPEVTGFTGGGTESNPYYGTPESGPLTLTYTYKNMSESLTMNNLNFRTNKLPFGYVVDPDLSTCPVESGVSNLGPQAECNLVYKLDKELLKNYPTGGTTLLQFESPLATWTTESFGFYSQFESTTSGTTFTTYLQPTISFVLSNNESSFESTVLTMTATNESVVSSLHGNSWSVDGWLESVPVNQSANCSVNNSDMSVSCNLKESSSVGEVTYIMPNYVQQERTYYFPLSFSTNAGEYAYLDPSYTFIKWFIPSNP